MRVVLWSYTASIVITPGIMAARLQCMQRARGAITRLNVKKASSEKRKDGIWHTLHTLLVTAVIANMIVLVSFDNGGNLETIGLHLEIFLRSMGCRTYGLQLWESGEGRILLKEQDMRSWAEKNRVLQAFPIGNRIHSWLSWKSTPATNQWNARKRIEVCKEEWVCSQQEREAVASDFARSR